MGTLCRWLDVFGIEVEGEDNSYASHNSKGCQHRRGECASKVVSTGEGMLTSHRVPPSIVRDTGINVISTV